MNDPQKHALFHFRQHITYLMDIMLKDTDIIQSSIESLRASIPREEDAHGGSQSQQHDLQVKINPLLIISTALSGVFYTHGLVYAPSGEQLKGSNWRGTKPTTLANADSASYSLAA
jgi:hypothetical protein